MTNIVIQADIELLAQIHEAARNNAAAFTLRHVGAVGTVLVDQADLLAKARIASEQATVAETIERCAKVVDRFGNNDHGPWAIAAAIRSLSHTKGNDDV